MAEINGKMAAQGQNFASSRPRLPMAEIQCFNCDHLGHISRDCPLPDRRLAAGNANAGPQGQGRR